MSAGAKKGDQILFRIDGSDEVETAAKLEALFKGNFGE